MYSLRPYQESAVSAMITEIKAGCLTFILRAPTGAGKTIIAARVIYGAQSKGKRVLFLAHRTELITQCSEKLSEMDVFHGIVMGGYNPQITAKVHIASVATLVNRLTFPEPDIIIVDEAHHARATSYEKIITRYPKAVVIGLTATPARTDGKGLGTMFKKIIDTISYTELIEQGFLVPFRIFEPTSIDFSKVETTAGDFNKKQIGETLAKSKIYGDVIKHWLDKAKDRSTILFASSVADSKRFVESFSSIGVVAAHVDGTTKPEERKTIFEGFKAGKIQVISNVGVATEGTDLPRASCISLANPTKSLVLHHQMVGRGLRIFEGKEDCLILDHVGNHQRLGWIDDVIEWTLDGKKKCRNKSAEERTTTPIRTCPECFFCMRGGVAVCERCGYSFPVKSRQLKTVDTQLHEATREGRKVVYSTQKDELTYLAEKIIVGKSKGYKPGWAHNQFKVVFKHYPGFRPVDIQIRVMELRMEKEGI